MIVWHSVCCYPMLRWLITLHEYQLLANWRVILYNEHELKFNKLILLLMYNVLNFFSTNRFKWNYSAVESERHVGETVCKKSIKYRNSHLKFYKSIERMLENTSCTCYDRFFSIISNLYLNYLNDLKKESLRSDPSFFFFWITGEQQNTHVVRTENAFNS